MSYLNDTSPADTDAVKKGANQIRSLKTSLNTLIAQIWDDTGAFLTGWITSAMFTAGSVLSAALGTGAVTTTKIADGALSADSVGRAKMADGFIEAAKLASDFELPGAAIPADTITTEMITDGAVTTDEIADGAVTLAKLSASNLFSKVYMGSILIPASPINNIPISIPGVNPDFVILFSNTTGTGFGGLAGSAQIAFRSEQVTGYLGTQISRYRRFDGSVPYTFDPLRTGGILWTGNGFSAQAYDFTDGHGITGTNNPPIVQNQDTTLIYLAVVA